MIYLLFFTLLVFTIIAYGLFDRDILSPAVIICTVYLFSTLSAMYNIKTWAIDLQLSTYAIISCGVLIFGFVSYVVSKKYKIYYFQENNKLISHKASGRIINIQPFKVYLVIIFSIIFFLIYVKSIFTLSESFGASSELVSIMNTYRTNVSYGDASLPFLVNQMEKMMECIAYLFLYVFINNIIIGGKAKNNYIYIIPTLLYVVASLFAASRTDMLHFFIATLTIYYVVWLRKYNWSRKINTKYIRNCFLSIIIFLVLFSFIRSLVGRLNEMDPLSYITSYAGGSIQLLDLYLKNPLSTTSGWGAETFAALHNNLAKFGIGQNIILHQEFRESNGILLGNIYTGLRKYYQDFGFSGVIIFQSLLAIIFSIGYYRLKLIKNNEKFDLAILIYIYFVPVIFMNSIQEMFFSSYFCFNSIVIICMIWIFYHIFVKCKIKFK